MATQPFRIRSHDAPQLAGAINDALKRGWEADPNALAQRSKTAERLEFELLEKGVHASHKYVEVDFEIALGQAIDASEAVYNVVSKHSNVSMVGAQVIEPLKKPVGCQRQSDFVSKLRIIVYGDDAAAVRKAAREIGALPVAAAGVVLNEDISAGQTLKQALARMMMVLRQRRLNELARVCNACNLFSNSL